MKKWLDDILVALGETEYQNSFQSELHEMIEGEESIVRLFAHIIMSLIQGLSDYWSLIPPTRR